MDIGGIIKNAVHSIRLRDARGVVYEISSDTQNDFIEFKPEMMENKDGVAKLALRIKNISGKTLFVDEARVLDISNKKTGALDLGDRINSWTMLTAGLGPGVKDLCDPCHNENKLDYLSPYYSLIGNRATGRYALFGFLTFGRQHSEIRLKAVEGFKFESLKAVCCLCEAPLLAGEELLTETLYVDTAAAPSSAADAYFGLLASQVSGAKVNFKDIVGWATWDYYQDKITEDDVLKNMEWLARHRDTVPVEYIQLDAGFQFREGDWLEANKKFPHGLKWLAAKIAERGFKPGLWLCPFLVAPQSKVYLEHPDWVIKIADGNPLEVSGYAVKTVYALDCSIPAACDWVRELARIVTEDYGYSYIKLDGANDQGMSPLGVLSNPKISKGEAMRKGLAAFKEGMKEDAFLLGASLFGISLGVVDGMRVGEDVGARWDSSKIAKHHGERDSFNGPGEVLRAIAATMNHCHQHKRLWINDSDYMVVRQKGSNSELSYEEAQSWASIAGLSNGLAMLSDNMEELKPERVRLLERVLPHYKAAAKPLDFFSKNVPSLYDLEVGNSSGKWHVVCICNTDYPAREREYILDFKKLGFAEDEECHVFDFWRREYMGVFSGAYKVILQPHCCQVVAVRRRLPVPQVLATDIHISCGGLELESSEFKDDVLRIKLSASGRSGNIFIFVPDDFKPGKGMKRHSKNVWKAEVKLDGGAVEYAFKQNTGKAENGKG